jgi:hypothetical protein
MLARLARAGELSAVRVPDAVDDALRDLVRAREDARLMAYLSLVPSEDSSGQRADRAPSPRPATRRRGTPSRRPLSNNLFEAGSGTRRSRGHRGILGTAIAQPRKWINRRP